MGSFDWNQAGEDSARRYANVDDGDVDEAAVGAWETFVGALGRGTLKDFRAPFDFQEFDPKLRAFVLITDEEKRREIGRKISPINHVSSDDPPTLIIHGDADKLVPIQQAETIIAKLKEAGVPAELVVKKGAGHGWSDLLKDIPTFADWFDKHLKR